MPRQLRVFLCHASQDKPAVWKIYRFLKQRGVQPWLDQADLLPGQKWEVEIPKAINESDVILVCISKNSVSKEGYVQKEIAFALDKALEKPEGTIFVIPVRLEECDVPRRLSLYHWVDYYRPDGRKRLLMGLNVRATDLGDDVSPVILEDTRRVKPISKPVAANVEKQAAEETADREKAERDRLEKEAAEKAERDRLEKEAAEKTERDRIERESAEKAERDRLEQESAEKAERDRLEQKASETAERDRIEREAAEKAERDRLKKEAAEKAESDRLEKEATEKAERDRLEKEGAEKAERDRLEKEAAEKAERDRIEREAAKKAERQPVAQVSNPTNTTNEKASRAASPTYEKASAPLVEKKKESVSKPARKMNVRSLGIGAIVLAFLLLALFGGNYLLKNMPSSTTETPQTITVALSKTNTPAPTKTFTPKPPTMTPTPSIGSTMIGEDGMTLVYVPAGEFTMGSDADDALVECQKYRLGCQRSWFTDEEPPHQVNLDAFWIDQTEVTNTMYAKCVADGDCEPPSSLSSYTHNSYYGNSEFGQYPVIYVDWNQANKYCTWAGRELPTEAEWEKAARGTDGRMYPWGNTFDGTIVNFCDANCSFGWANKSFDDGYADVAPVGNYPTGKSIYGALDMAGNVWEWVSSLYKDYPYDASDGREDLSASGSRVLRGGSWNYVGSDVRSAYRSRNDPSNSDYSIGFRCSLSQP